MAMKELEINCVTKLRDAQGRERVTGIGNNTHRWSLSHEVAMARIETLVEAYYTLDRKTKKRAYVGVVREPGKAPRLRTHADGFWTDDLLARAECGAACVRVA